MLFEGAQGTFLDIDHGTYPFVTSSNTTAGGAATGSGVAPAQLDYVLGITKAYATRVGSGPFPTELSDDIGERLASRGHEFGAPPAGRAAVAGWIAVALRRAVQLNGVTGLCVTKLDVLDGLETVRLCIAYDWSMASASMSPPSGAERFGRCEPGLRGLARVASVHGRRDPSRGHPVVRAPISEPGGGDGGRAGAHCFDRARASGDRDDSSTRLAEPREGSCVECCACTAFP